MQSGWRLEQLFVRRVAGRITLLAVLENPAGARKREEIPTPSDNPRDAIRFLARHLARRSDVDGTTRLRIREDRNGEMTDRPEWRETFHDAFDDEREEDAFRDSLEA